MLWKRIRRLAMTTLAQRCALACRAPLRAAAARRPLALARPGCSARGLGFTA